MDARMPRVGRGAAVTAHAAMLPFIRPTLAGKVSGIVDDDPWTVQCQDCGVTASGPRIGLLVILSGYRFHICEGPQGIRRCADCLRAVKDSCPDEVCKR